MTDIIPNLSLNDPGPPSPPSDLLSDPIPDRSVISFISPSVPFLFFLCVCVCVPLLVIINYDDHGRRVCVLFVVVVGLE